MIVSKLRLCFKPKPERVCISKKNAPTQVAKENAMRTVTRGGIVLKGMPIQVPDRITNPLSGKARNEKTKRAFTNALSIASARAEENDCDIRAVYMQLKNDLTAVAANGSKNAYEGALEITQKWIDGACNAVEGNDLRDFRLQIKLAYFVINRITPKLEF